MGKCKALEPAPTRFYAPSGLFTNEDLRQMSAEGLGYVIVSPGGSFRYRVISGPLWRLYWEHGKLQPNANESAYSRNSSGKGWRRSHPNFLSYQIADGSFVTVRWQLPVQQNISSHRITKSAA